MNSPGESRRRIVETPTREPSGAGRRSRLKGFQSLPPLFDPRFQQVRLSPNLVVGEMNFRQPNAKAFHFPDGSHLITIYSGLLDFYSSACQILMQAGSFHTEKGESEGRSQEDLLNDLKELFLTWTPQGIQENRSSEHKLSTVSPERMMSANRLLEGALRFILCHELGHVLFYKPSGSEKLAKGLTREQETISDVAGMQTALMQRPDPGCHSHEPGRLRYIAAHSRGIRNDGAHIQRGSPRPAHPRERNFCCAATLLYLAWSVLDGLSHRLCF